MAQSHNNIVNLSTETDELVSYDNYKEYYNERINETLLESQLWSPEIHKFNMKNTENEEKKLNNPLTNSKPNQEFFDILNRNDKLKREIDNLELENSSLIQKSKENQDTITKLMKELSTLVNDAKS